VDKHYLFEISNLMDKPIWD